MNKYIYFIAGLSFCIISLCNYYNHDLRNQMFYSMWTIIMLIFAGLQTIKDLLNKK